MVLEKRQLKFRYYGAIILCRLPSAAYCLSSAVYTTSKYPPETLPSKSNRVNRSTDNGSTQRLHKETSIVCNTRA